MTILRRVGRQPYWHEVFQLGNSVRQQEARNQDVRGRPIELLVPHTIRVGRNSETATVLVIQDRSENTGRIKVWVAVPVDRAVHAYQGNCPHVTDDSVILDRLIGHCCIPFSMLRNESTRSQSMSVFFAKLTSFAKMRRPLKSRSTNVRKTLCDGDH